MVQKRLKVDTGLILLICLLLSSFVYSDSIIESGGFKIRHEDTYWKKGIDAEHGYEYGSIYTEEKVCEDGKEGTYYYTLIVPPHPEAGIGVYNKEPSWSPAYFDDQSWICDECGGVWEPTADGGEGECCGDDIVGNNPSGADSDNDGDDPDMGPRACAFCEVATNQPISTEIGEKAIRGWSESVPTDTNRCCGDDPGDCGAVVDSFLCTDTPGGMKIIDQELIDPNTGSIYTEQIEVPTQGYWYWLDSQQSTIGVIVDSTCAIPSNLTEHMSYISDGEKWIGCGESLSTPYLFDLDYSNPQNNEVSNPYAVLDHDYFCYEQGLSYQIVECCGGNYAEDPICNNDYPDPAKGALDFGKAKYEGDDNFYSGYSAETPAGTYFCREDHTFSTDLDDSPYACENARFPPLNNTLRHYLWSGTLCCGEPEDKPEYYNDPAKEPTGACFNSTPLKNNGPPLESLPQLKAIQGNISACLFNQENYHSDFEWLKQLTDTHSGKELIHNKDICTVDPSYQFYCDYDGEWKLTPQGKNISNLVFLPGEWRTDSLVEAGCCLPEECWNGTECVENQARYNLPNDKARPIKGPDNYTGYRCSDGEWTWTELKKEPQLGGDHGYCSRPSQCLVDVDGKYEDNNDPDSDPQCIADGQYIEDYYCEDGKWGSRTKFIALSLLSMVSENEDYTLYCGPYKDTLNYFDYTTDEYYLSIPDLLEDISLPELNDKIPIVNNFCVLKRRDQLVIATSLNQEVRYSELDDVLDGFSSCNPLDGEGFHSCNRDSFDNSWLSKDLNSIMYSNQDFSLAQYDLDELFNKIKNPLDSAITNLRQRPETEHFNYHFIENGLKFRYLYSARESGKEISSTLDESRIIASYKNINYDVCDVIDTYNITYAEPEMSSGLACATSPNSYDIILEGGLFSNINPYALWSDLTGKLRLE